MYFGHGQRSVMWKRQVNRIQHNMNNDHAVALAQALYGVFRRRSAFGLALQASRDKPTCPSIEQVRGAAPGRRPDPPPVRARQSSGREG